MTSALRLADAPDSDQERRNRQRLGGNGGAKPVRTISLSDGRPLSTGREGASGAFSGAVLGAVLIMGGLPLVGRWYSGRDTMVRVTTGDTQLEGVLSSDGQRERGPLQDSVNGGNSEDSALSRTYYGRCNVMEGIISM